MFCKVRVQVEYAEVVLVSKSSESSKVWNEVIDGALGRDGEHDASLLDSSLHSATSLLESVCPIIYYTVLSSCVSLISFWTAFAITTFLDNYVVGHSQLHQYRSWVSYSHA